MISSFFRTSDDIRAKDVTIGDVRRKMKDNPLLCKQDDKKVIDKIRDLFSKVEDSEMPESLPQETVSQKLDRMFDATHQSEITEEQSTLASVKTAKGVFSKEDANNLACLCCHIIQSGKIHTLLIEQALKGSNAGRKILENYQMDQIRNRVKYERLKYVKQWK